jgi:hypothetical protein
MSEASTGSQRPAGEPDAIFECDFCASRHSDRAIQYNWLGYPVCSVCEYDHGPWKSDDLASSNQS